MSSLSPVNVGPAIGPLFVKNTKREHYAHEQTETASLTDRVFQDKSVDLGLAFLDYRHSNAMNVQSIPRYAEVVEQYSDMVQEHVERRISFFFQQLIACYQTKLHFEASGAQDQAKSADAIFLNINGNREKLCSRNAAHSSTLPCLIAYDNEEWQAYQEEEAPKPQGFVFLKGTDYYRAANTTMNMPEWVNDADREIDEKTEQSLLREKALSLVNQASQGEITPDEGMSLFLEDALVEIQAAQTRLRVKEQALKEKRKGAMHPQERRNLWKMIQERKAQRKTLSLYETYFLQFQEEMETDPAVLEGLLNLKMEGGAQRVILQIRYAAIRGSLLQQSALIQKIRNVKSEVLTLLGRQDRKPNYFDAAFKTVFVEQAKVEKNRHRLEKLLNFSPFDFQAKMAGKTQRQKTEFANVTEALSQGPVNARIRSVAREIFRDMRQMRTEEEYQRAQTVKDLRAMKGWQQWRLGLEIKELFPNAATSQSTISNIERRKKLVTVPIAEELSQVFEVDSGLFMPHFFYE